jgi:hypothetical protein
MLVVGVAHPAQLPAAARVDARAAGVGTLGNVLLHSLALILLLPAMPAAGGQLQSLHLLLVCSGGRCGHMQLHGI